MTRGETFAAHDAMYGPDRVPDERSMNAAIWHAYERQREHLPAALLLLKQLSQPDRVHERLSKYEQRLEYTIHRCLAELATLQKRPKDGDEELPPSPYLNDVPPPSMRDDELAGDGQEQEAKDADVAQPPSAVIQSEDRPSSSEDTAEGGRATTITPAQNEPTAELMMPSERDASDGQAVRSLSADAEVVDDATRVRSAAVRAPAD